MQTLIDLVKDNEPLLNVSFEIEGTEYSFNLGKELSFTFETIEDEMKNHAEKLSIILTAYEKAESLRDKLKLEISKLTAEKWVSLKDPSNYDYNAKPLSDKRIDMLIECDSDLCKLKQEENKITSDVRKLKNIIQMFQQKKELMQTCSATFRKLI